MEEKQKKLDKREYTLMLVPHHGQKIRSIKIPIVAIKCTISILCLLIVCMAGFFWDYRHTVSTVGMQTDELEILRQNNNAQVSQIEQLARTTTILQADMERLNSLDAEIRRIVNNEDMTTTSRAGLVRPSVNYNGQGGPQVQSDVTSIHNAASDLQATVKVREQDLIELKQELLAKRARLEITPSIWPTSGDVTSRFGWRNSPFGGGSDWHPGIDIANSSGTPIVATANGEVIQSEWYGGYGNMVHINHGNGITTVYGHNSQNLVHAGQVVKKGQVIAYLGNTGYSTGPHVHYEVRINGTAVNPDMFLK
ncbi:MAG: peptidoglycan DD-metalloendopeptidase family protein [Sporomusaceae bacterium]|nr:peptidoglycan DD-metalloendopeptidase family protein [Sporomusaceae bacterium]